MRSALVVGATGGIGAATVRALSGLGWRVFAAGRDRASLAVLAGLPGVVTVPLDVTDPDAVASARDSVVERTDRLDAVVYAAGVLGQGSLAEMPLARLERVLDINTLGAARVVQAFLPPVARARGRIVIVTSEMARRSGHAFNGPYSMSKKALDGYADSLRRELVHVGVRVVKVQPGPARTAMVAGVPAAFESAAAESPGMRPYIDTMAGLAAGLGGTTIDPAKVARVIVLALRDRRPRPTYRINTDPGRLLLDLLPVRSADAVLARLIRPRPRR